VIISVTIGDRPCAPVDFTDTVDVSERKDLQAAQWCAAPALLKSAQPNDPLCCCHACSGALKRVTCFAGKPTLSATTHCYCSVSAIQRASLVGKAAPTTVDLCRVTVYHHEHSCGCCGASCGHGLRGGQTRAVAVWRAWRVAYWCCDWWSITPNGRALVLFLSLVVSHHKSGRGAQGKDRRRIQKGEQAVLLMLHPHTQCPHSPVGLLVHLLFRFMHLLLRQYAAAI
jgi:hypothetical protein